MIQDIINDTKKISKELELDNKESLMVLLIQELKNLREVLNDISNKK